MRAGIAEVLPSFLTRKEEPEQNARSERLLRASASCDGSILIPMEGTNAIRIQFQNRGFGSAQDEDYSQQHLQKPIGQRRSAAQEFLHGAKRWTKHLAKIGIGATGVNGLRALIVTQGNILYVLTDPWVLVPFLGALVLFSASYTLREFLKVLEERDRLKELLRGMDKKVTYSGKGSAPSNNSMFG